MSRIYMSLFLVCAMSCTTPDTINFAQPHPAATVEEIFVATQQTPNSDDEAYRNDRATRTSHAKLSVSIPPTHVLGQIEWPDDRPDPLKDFAVVGFDPLDSGDTFYQALADAPGNEIYLFIHGYNNTTSEALYRYAQIATDFQLPQARVMFSWPSAGVPQGYVYDRDSVLFARDGLVELLTDIARKTDKEISLFAHSMGGLLAMESMRQLALTGDRDVLDAIDVVTMMSPDIDPDIFRMQATTIGTLPDPFVILTSRSDRALRVSSFLIGGRPKVGEISSAEDVAGLNVTFVDFTDLSDGRNMDHMTAVTSPAAIAVLRQMVQQDEIRQSEFAEYLVLDSSNRR